MKTYKTPIKASALIEKISSGEIEAEVRDDEDCEPKLMHTDICAEDNGNCTVTVYYFYQEDQPNHGVSAGSIHFDVCGVHFSADRDFDGEHEEFEMSGREIVYDGDLTEEDVREAVEDNVDLPVYDYSNYEFDSSEISDEDIIDSVEEHPEYFAEHEGEVFGYDDEDDIPEGYEIIDSDDAIAKLIAKGDINYEQWG